jgi:hypothetical protein
MLSVPRLYSEEQMLLRESLETAVRRVVGWCEMAVSLRGHEPESREHALLEDLAKQSSEYRD